MKSKECAYLSERKYQKYYLNEIDKEQKSYWIKIVGETALADFFADNKLSEQVVLNSDYYDFEIKGLNILTELEKRFLNKEGNGIFIPWLETQKQRLVFDNFYLPLVKLGLAMLREREQDTEIFEESFTGILLERLSKVSMGILMFEMQLNKKEGNLRGNNEKEEYIFYNDKMLKDIEYLQKLFDIYPVWERILFETINTLVDNYDILIKRLERDREEIQQKWNLTEWQISKIEASGSDSHNKGKTVMLIELKNGLKIVYKPRSLKPEITYQEFCSKISQKCKYPTKSIKIIDKGEYGWEEFIKASSCKTQEELKRYYYRFGILIFINYILNANDLHVENVVAQGEHPVIIDAETILDNKREYQQKNARMMLSERIHESVLYSGLLPQYRFSRKGKAIDMSAINGREGEEYPILIPVIKNVGTSNMCYEYGHPITKANNNLARLNGKFIEPRHFMSEISIGFKDAYNEVLNNRNDVLIHIEKFANVKVRHLIQDTQRYSMILHTSVHPYFMQNGKDRSLFLASMYKNYNEVQGNGKVVRAEIEDMLHMDIPYFYLNTSDTSLFGSNGEKIEGYFKMDSMTHLREKIQNMNIEERDTQERFIKITLTNLDECEKDMSVRKFQIVQEENENKEILWRAVKNIAEQLRNTAVWGETKKDVNWLGISSVGQRGNTTWSIQPLGNYLYDGIAGIAIFFRALQKVSGGQEYKEFCQAIENNLFEYTDEMLGSTDFTNESSGVFSGEAGIVYTYLILYRLTEEKKYMEYAQKHAKIMSKIIPSDSDYDIIYGNAGAVLVILQLYKLTKDKQYYDMACNAGEVLLKEQIISGEDKGGWKGGGTEMALAGFSHGTAGIVYALAKLWEITGRKDILESIKLGLEFESRLYNEKAENWVDRRERTEEELAKYSCFMTAWCHGAAGILLGRTKIYHVIPEEYKKSVRRDIDIALNTVGKTGFNTNDCLCHGNLGNTEICMEYAKVFHDDMIKQKYQRIRGKIAEDICKDSYDCGRAYLYGYKIPGLMTGISGMGYSLLRDLDDKLPCVLSVEL